MTAPDNSPNTVHLRDVTRDDLPIFFVYEQDPDAVYMAGFTAKDPSDKEAFMAHWDKILNSDKIIKQTILYGDQVAGHITQFEQFGEPEISYWIDSALWGKGIATSALALFLKQVTTRPLYARAVKDNKGSIRVLEKCGFVISGEDTGFANARGAEVEEFILQLK